jgi:putative transposase
MSTKYKFWDSHKMYFISYATVNWIDVFIRNEYKEELISCWKYCQQTKGLEIYAWCIMPSHVHMIISSNKNNLEDIVRDMKSYTSRRLKKAITENNQESRREWMLWMMQRAGLKNSNNKDWQFWQQTNKPLEINTARMYTEVVHYIHQNPVVSGFVFEASQWVYSSAKGYGDNTGLIKLAEL